MTKILLATIVILLIVVRFWAVVRTALAIFAGVMVWAGLIYGAYVWSFVLAPMLVYDFQSACVSMGCELFVSSVQIVYFLIFWGCLAWLVEAQVKARTYTPLGLVKVL